MQLALSCLLKYKLKYLIPYGELLSGLLQKGCLRNSLLKFQEWIELGKLDDSHRERLLPLICRILFGRISAKGGKSSKDSPTARRAAILSFLSVLCRDENELFPFIYMMTRCFISWKHSLKDMESYDADDRDKIMTMLLNVKSDEIGLLPTVVVEGFLNLLETVISHMGHRIIACVPQFTSITLAISEFVAVTQESEESAPAKVASDGMETRKVARYGPIRTLCFQRLSNIFERFGSSSDFMSFSGSLWHSLSGSIAILPEMVIKSEKAPSLLLLLETMSKNPQLIKLIGLHDQAVEAVVKCIAETSFDAVMSPSLTFVENLLTAEISESQNTQLAGLQLIRKYVPLLMEQFTLRLQKGSERNPHQAIFKMKGKNVSSLGHKLRQTTWRRELRILCGVSKLISSEEGIRLKDKSSVLENLCSLLLPYLEPDRISSDEDKLNILGILKGTVTQLDRTSMTSIYDTLSNTLGPVKSRSGIKSLSVRQEISSLIYIIAGVEPELSRVAKKLVKLTALNTKRVDELDFESVIPELNSLGANGAANAWVSLCGNTDAKPLILTPIISTCYHYLYNEDGVISRSSFNALKSLVATSAEEFRKREKDDSGSGTSWIRLVESSIMPLARAGLQSRDSTIRRFYILLVRAVCKSFQHHPSPNLCGDLCPLYNDENPDLDFFVNITHVQIHRRARAFQRLRKVLNMISDDGPTTSFSSQSLANILLPLAMHPAYECTTKAEEAFALEAIATVGAISRLISWNKYNNMLWTILTHFDKYPEQERYLVAMMCAIIDGFSFELTVDDSSSDQDEDVDTKTAVWRALERRIIPKIEGLLTKEKVDRSGRRTKIIRPTIVLALLKLFQKFPQSFFESKLPHILTVMCDALRNKESDARDIARVTLAKLVISMDLKYLADVVREVAITLTEGYKLHVRAAVIHTILQELSTVYQPPPQESLKSSAPSYFDKCIPALMDVIQDDLFGEANERRESKETNVRYVKEAGGSKSIHSIEIICRLIVFKPSGAGKFSVMSSAVHCVVSPLLERLRLPDVETSTIRKIKEILMRVVIGLSHNPTVQADELFPFVYATVQPFIGAQAISSVFEKINVDDGEDTEEKPIRVSGGTRDSGAESKAISKSGMVVEWRPSTLNTLESAKAASANKKKERRELLKVRDGASAPKLTGSSRHGAVDVAQGLNNPSSVNAVLFGLNLLNSCIKNLKVDINEKLEGMIDPFVPLLTACVCHCRDTDVALVALKCLMSFLRFRLPSISACSKSLGTQSLEFLSSSGSSLNQNHDLTQACFKTLTHLIKIDIGESSQGFGSSRLTELQGENALSGAVAMPLNSEQMKVLISLLQVSVAESEQHNPALGLIKAILSRRYISPEFYDLMESLLKLVVRSQKASLRQVSASLC